MARRNRATEAESYSHVGCRAAVGHYAVTSDATRAPGKVHALNPIPGGRAYKALCGVVVHEESGDHFMHRGNPVSPVGPDDGRAVGSITCARCLRKSGAVPPTDAELGELRLRATEAIAAYRETWLADGSRTADWHERFERQGAAKGRLREALWRRKALG